MLPSATLQFEQARARGRAEGKHILGKIREAVEKSSGPLPADCAPLTAHPPPPPCRFCLQCQRVWPVGTFQAESIARLGRCPSCINSTEAHPPLLPAA